MNNTINLHAYYLREGAHLMGTPVVGWSEYGVALVCNYRGDLTPAATASGFQFFDVAQNHSGVRVDGTLPLAN